MKKTTISRLLALILALAMCLSLAACGGASAPAETPAPAQSEAPAETPAAAEETPAAPEETETPATRIVIDSAGNEIEVPYEVKRVVPVGAYPVILSFILALGQGDTIVAGVPASFAPGRLKYCYVIAPYLESIPPISVDSSGSLDVESAVSVDADVFITTTKSTADDLAEKGLPVFYMSNAEGQFTAYIELLGQLYNVPERAQEYIDYLDEALDFVAERTKDIPDEERASVLYFSKGSMTRIYATAEWYIPAVGAVSATEDQKDVQKLELDLESLIARDPDIIIFSGYSDVQAAYDDPDWAGLSAVKNGRLYPTPIGIHNYGNGNCAEFPVFIYWLATTIYPDLFSDIDINEIMKEFYSEFFDFDLTDEQVQEILNPAWYSDKK